MFMLAINSAFQELQRPLYSSSSQLANLSQLANPIQLANPVQVSNTFIVTPNMLTAHEVLWGKEISMKKGWESSVDNMNL